MIDGITELLAGFTLLRPWWLSGIIVSFGLLLLTQRVQGSAGWRHTIDPAFVHHLRVVPDNTSVSKRNRKLRWWLLLPLSIGFVALSGPAWQQLPASVAANQQAMIIVLDLSPSMYARDITPDRITMARLKLIDILRRRQDGDTALLVYAGSVHRVAPLTDDPAIIASLVDNLSPALMPVAGSEVETAVAEAGRLLHDAGLTQGDILLITDGVSADAAQSIKQLVAEPLPNGIQGVRLSILGIGTDTGAPIPVEDGALLTNESGQTIVARLNTAILQSLATQYDGHFSTLTVDSADVDHLLALPALPFRAKVDNHLQTFDSRQDAGYWLILLLLPLSALLFRRHLVWVLIPIILLPLDSKADDTSRWWQTSYQRGIAALDQGDLELAAKLLPERHWQAVILYRQGDYKQAARLYSDDRSATGFYNLGNALAMDGQYEPALDAYAQALALQTATSIQRQQDIQFNHLLVTRLLAELNEQEQEQQQSQSDRSGGDEDENQSDNSEQQDNESRDTASDSDQQQIGGDTGEGNSLDQQAMQQQGASSALDQREQQTRDPATDATPVDSQAADTSSASDDGQAATNTVKAEKNSNTVLNPYSEQWLRELPQDPGGYLRRKFSYEFQTRQSIPAIGDRY
ncbi:MAG: VWA domain-containing protein [Granulosicoccus sp.]|nr:VWA domain-containing protein [Granulosicoccus sp.]